MTSFSELARDAREVERRNRLHPLRPPETSHVAALPPGRAPIVAATDYVRAYPQLIASYVAAPFTALGTDGFGRSDTRAALRSFFEVDRRHIVVAALAALATEGSVSRRPSPRRSRATTLRAGTKHPGRGDSLAKASGSHPPAKENANRLEGLFRAAARKGLGDCLIEGSRPICCCPAREARGFGLWRT